MFLHFYLLNKQQIKSVLLFYFSFYNDIICAARILIDFGSSSEQTTDPGWNNVIQRGDTNTASVLYENLVDSSDVATVIDLIMTNWTIDVNTGGTTAGAFDYPGSATRDSCYIATPAWNIGHFGTGTSYVYFTSLNPAKLYSFTFFASRMGTTENRETEYVLEGQSTEVGYLNPSGNTDQRVTVSALNPDSNGQILLQVGPGPNNVNSYKFGYLGVLDITEIPEPMFALTLPLLGLILRRWM